MNIRTSSSQERLKRIFTHNLREKAIAAVCAAVFLILSFCFKPVSRIYSVKVGMKTAPDQTIVFSSTDHVEVKVSGNFFELRKIKSEDLVINFDFSSENAGEISRSVEENLLPQSFAALDVKNIVPQILTVKTELQKQESAPEEEPAETSPETSTEQKPAEAESEPAETVADKPDENAVKAPAAEEKNE